MTRVLTQEEQSMLQEVFSYHAPTGDQELRYVAIRNAARWFAQAILTNTEKSADQSAALRKIREAVMTANAAIALEKQLPHASETQSDLCSFCGVAIDKGEAGKVCSARRAQ